MKFLKGLAVTIVGFLLFLSLSAFTTMFMLKQTLINPEFVVAELNQLDAAELGKEMLGDQIKAQLPAELSGLSGSVDEIFDEMAPWFKEKMGDITYAVFDYLGSRSDRLSVAISLEPVKTSIEAKIKQVLAQSPPPSLAALPAGQRAQLVDQYAQQYAGQVPDTFEFGDGDLPAQYRGIVSQLRWAVTNFDALYYGLIGLMALAVLCLIALYHNVKGFSRSLGSTLLTVGVFGFVSILVSERLILPQAGAFGLPSELGRWVTQFMIDIAAPLKGLYIGLAAGGLALFLLSIFYRRGAGKDAGVSPRERPS